MEEWEAGGEKPLGACQACPRRAPCRRARSGQAWGRLCSAPVSQPRAGLPRHRGCLTPPPGRQASGTQSGLALGCGAGRWTFSSEEQGLLTKLSSEERLANPPPAGARILRGWDGGSATSPPSPGLRHSAAQGEPRWLQDFRARPSQQAWLWPLPLPARASRWRRGVSA